MDLAREKYSMEGYYMNASTVLKGCALPGFIIGRKCLSKETKE